MPLAGETTTAVFYPVRWGVYQVVEDPHRAIAVYVWLHLVLASWAARRLAILGFRRRGPPSIRSAAIAGWIYPFSGGVLFLVTNPPFLVSAAWLPVALGWMVGRGTGTPGERWHTRSGGSRDPYGVLWAMVSVAMMVLGGDPQTALHAMIVMTLGVVAQSIGNGNARSMLGPLCTVGSIGAVAACLAAPQIAASVDWSWQSERIGGIAASQRYGFSLAPWRFAEWVNPHASGRHFPINQRITSTIAGDGAMWTPSIYAGIIGVPAILGGLMAMGRPQADRRRIAWCALTLIAAAAAMGHFGPVWWIQTVSGRLGQWPSELGGVYDLLCRVVPGYDAFRYPAKWLPLVSLGTAMLAARLINDRSRRRWRAIAFATMAVMVLAVAWNEMVVRQSRGAVLADPFWGPLQVDEAAKAVRWSYVVTIMNFTVMGIGWVAWSRRRISFRGFRGWWITAVAIDLTIFGIQTLPTVSTQDVIERQREIVSTFPGQSDPASSWMRYSQPQHWPAAWKSQSDPKRMIDVEASLRSSRFGRWHLADRIAVLNSMHTIQSLAYHEYWKSARKSAAAMTPAQADRFWQSMREQVGAAGIMDEQGVLAGEEQTLCGAKFSREHREWLRYRSDQMEVALVEREGHAATYEIEVRQPGSIARPVYQDGHWHAWVTRQPDHSSNADTELRTETDAPLMRDGLSQTMNLSAGRWRVSFVYRPWWYWPSIALSWVAVAGCIARAFGAGSLVLSAGSLGKRPIKTVCD